MASDTPAVLVVDDEGVVADVYAELLGDDYACDVAYSGEAAIEAYHPGVDVVLLDRRMPDMPGDDVLETLRELDGESRIAMVTAVQPDFDVLDMGFDDYLVKPVSQRELQRTVRTLLELSAYSDEVRRYYSLVTKRAWLETEKSVRELESNRDYRELEAEISTLESRLDRTVRAFSAADYEDAFRDIHPDQPSPTRVFNSSGGSDV
jgi:DNA-binding response OmpR family regulator